MKKEKKTSIYPFIQKYILIRKNLFSAALIIGAMAVFPSVSLCEESSLLGEKTRILEIFKEMEYTINPSFNTPECKSIAADLQKNENYEILEPIVKTDDYHDSKLQAYIGKCHDLILNKVVGYEPRLTEYVFSLPPAEREKWGQVWNATRDFKLYRLNDSKNGNNFEKYIFYGGGWFSTKKNRRTKEEKQIQGPSSYSPIDLQKCTEGLDAQVSNSINYSTNQPTGNFNGAFKYKNNFYVFDIKRHADTASYHLTLFKLVESDKRVSKWTAKYQFNISCSYFLQEKGDKK